MLFRSGVRTKTHLPGTSAVHVSKPNATSIEAALRRAGVGQDINPLSPYYLGQHVALLRGETAGFGQDPWEVLLRSPQVVGVYLKADAGRGPIVMNPKP